MHTLVIGGRFVGVLEISYNVAFLTNSRLQRLICAILLKYFMVFEFIQSQCVILLVCNILARLHAAPHIYWLHRAQAL